MNKTNIYSKIQNYFRDKPVKKVEVIGSYARNQEKDASDIDIIITLDKQVSLFQLSGYRLALEHLLGIKVDLTTKAGIDPLILPYIEDEIETIYESA